MERDRGKNQFPLKLILAIPAAVAITVYYFGAIDTIDAGNLVRATVAYLLLALFLTYRDAGRTGLWRSAPRKVLIIGAGEVALKLGELLRKEGSSFTLAGYLPLGIETVVTGIDPDLLHTGGLITAVSETHATVVVVALTQRRGVLPLQDMMQCKINGVEIMDAATFYETVQGKLLLETITPGWLIFSPGFRTTRHGEIFKRFMDVVLSATCLLLFAPFFPLIALAIKLDSKGPVLFKQARTGSSERPFMLYKFRSMVEHAEQKGAVWATENDPRVTRVGRILRKFRIDEIPQLYNVLKGEMSLIGPRPERPEFVAMLKSAISHYEKRHAIKPGVTGWAQVRYPYGASVDDAAEKLRYDLYYVKNHSAVLDYAIIMETVKVMLLGRGAR